MHSFLYPGPFRPPPGSNFPERAKYVIKKSVLEGNSLLFEPNEYFDSYEDELQSIIVYGMMEVDSSLTDLKIVNTVFRNNLYGDETIIVSHQDRSTGSLTPPQLLAQ